MNRETPQTRVQALLDQLVLDGKERGIQVAAYHRGELVVNAYAGVMDANTQRPVREETLFPVFSVAKGITATIVHRLVERGLLSYEDPICKVWPEFAANGKAEITLRQGLNHTAGLPHMPPGMGYAELCDWKTMCSAIAELTPLWPPGSKMEYHAITFSWIVGEVACRVTGKSFPDLVKEEICQPLNVDTIFIGLPAALEDRVATLEGNETVPPAPPLGATEAIPHWLGPLHVMMNRSDARHACIPGSNGIMNALAIAKHYAALLTGGVDGIELLPANRVYLATQDVGSRPRPNPEDKPRGLGYGLGGGGSLYGGDDAFGHDGHGGPTGFADPGAQLAFGLTRNRFLQDGTKEMIVRELREVLF